MAPLVVSISKGDQPIKQRLFIFLVNVMSTVQERRVGSRTLCSTLLSQLLRCAERVAHGCYAQPIFECYRRHGVPFIHFQVSELTLSNIAVIVSDFCSLSVALSAGATPVAAHAQHLHLPPAWLSALVCKLPVTTILGAAAC